MLLPAFEFHEPETIHEALALKHKFGEKARLLAGGTDLLVHMKKKLVNADHLISLYRIPELSGVHEEKDCIIIGACTTMARLSKTPVIQERFNALKSGCDNLGTHLIRNRASIGGNVCNASPAGDTLPALYVYDAVVLIESKNQKREAPIQTFLTGPGKTCIKPDEILTGFRLPMPKIHSGAHYIQLGKRKSSEINVVNVASYLEYDPDSGTIPLVRIALGSVAATPIRSTAAETVLENALAEESLFFKAGEIARNEDCKPIDDFRGSAVYRRAMVGVLTKRTLSCAFEQAKRI